jgi:hypothetical protein
MSRGNHRRIGSPEEARPCGQGGLRAIYTSHRRQTLPDLSDCLAAPSARSLVVWEPLPTKAPGPDKTLPYCCYLRTVIFYHRPYIVRPFSTLWRGRLGRLQADRSGRSFQEWDKVETRLGWDDLVEFEGEIFEVGGGHVVWCDRRWWMCRGARRRAVRVAA